MLTWNVTISAGETVLWSAEVEAPNSELARGQALILMRTGGGRRPSAGLTGAAGEVVVKVAKARRADSWTDPAPLALPGAT
jgi:hypothetical protein